MRKTYEINNIAIDGDASKLSEYNLETVSRKQRQCIPISISKLTKIYINDSEFIRNNKNDDDNVDFIGVSEDFKYLIISDGTKVIPSPGTVYKVGSVFYTLKDGLLTLCDSNGHIEGDEPDPGPDPGPEPEPEDPDQPVDPSGYIIVTAGVVNHAGTLSKIKYKSVNPDESALTLTTLS